MTSTFYKALSPNLPSGFSTLPLICQKVCHFLSYAGHRVVYDTIPRKAFVTLPLCLIVPLGNA